MYPAARIVGNAGVYKGSFRTAEGFFDFDAK
jgi:hypothetical protein